MHIIFLLTDSFNKALCQSAATCRVFVPDDRSTTTQPMRVCACVCLVVFNLHVKEEKYCLHSFGYSKSCLFIKLRVVFLHHTTSVTLPTHLKFKI